MGSAGKLHAEMELQLQVVSLRPQTDFRDSLASSCAEGASVSGFNNGRHESATSPAYRRTVVDSMGYQPPIVPLSSSHLQKLKMPYKQRRSTPAQPTVMLVKNEEVMDREESKTKTVVLHSHTCTISGLSLSPALEQHTIPIPSRSVSWPERIQIHGTDAALYQGWRDDMAPPPRLVGVGLLVERDHQVRERKRKVFFLLLPRNRVRSDLATATGFKRNAREGIAARLCCRKERRH